METGQLQMPDRRQFEGCRDQQRRERALLRLAPRIASLLNGDVRQSVQLDGAE